MEAVRGYDTQDCVQDIRSRWGTPHVAQKKHSAIDGRTTRHAGYRVAAAYHLARMAHLPPEPETEAVPSGPPAEASRTHKGYHPFFSRLPGPADTEHRRPQRLSQVR